MNREFSQTVWDRQLQEDWQAILRLAVGEDLGRSGDWTTRALVPEQAVGRGAIVAREPGTIAGLPAMEATLREIEPLLTWSPSIEDGRAVAAGDVLGRIEGPARGLLSAERLALNLLGHLSGIATLTRAYVEAVADTGVRIYDTRKTTPGWRRLEKYAVRCGGGSNHRSGLHDAVLIKDNHLALGAERQTDVQTSGRFSPAEAVAKARRFLQEHATEASEMIVEIEVDSLEQLDEVLPAGADLILLDNMPPAVLREAVARRDARNPQVELEASGGVNLETVAEIARAGVDRISVGALTHSAPCLDVGLDWLERPGSERPGTPGLGGPG